MAIEATSMGRVQSADLLLKDLEACCVVWGAGDWAQARTGLGTAGGKTTSWRQRCSWSMGVTQRVAMLGSARIAGFAAVFDGPRLLVALRGNFWLGGAVPAINDNKQLEDFKVALLK